MGYYLDSIRQAGMAPGSPMGAMAARMWQAQNPNIGASNAIPPAAPAMTGLPDIMAAYHTGMQPFLDSSGQPIIKAMQQQMPMPMPAEHPGGGWSSGVADILKGLGDLGVKRGPRQKTDKSAAPVQSDAGKLFPQ